MHFRSNSAPLSGLLLLIAAWVTSWMPASLLGAPNPLPLTNIGQVRRLTVAEASKSYPVSVEAVVSGNGSIQFLHDATGNCYLPPGGLGLIPLGSRVRVEGVTDPGEFSPFIKGTNASAITSPRITFLSTAELPAPRRVSGQDLGHGEVDCSRLEMTGVIRTIEIQSKESITTAVLDVDRNRIEVFCSGIDGIAARLTRGSVIRVSGTYACAFNQRRQLWSGGFLYTTLDQIHIVEQPSVSGFTLPIIPIADIGRFTPTGRSDLQHIQGTITGVRDGQGFFVEDSGGSCWVESPVRKEFRVGQLVDAVGFPVLKRSVTSLEDVELRHAGSGKLPPPQPVSDAFAELGDFTGQRPIDHDGRRVRFRAHVESYARVRDAFLILFSELPGGFLGELSADGSERLTTRFPPGSLIDVTGVLRVDQDGSFRVQGARLLISSLDELTLITLPPIGERERWLLLLKAAGGALSALLLILFFVLRHRRQLTSGLHRCWCIRRLRMAR